MDEMEKNIGTMPGEEGEESAQVFKERLKKNFETSRREADETIGTVRKYGEDFLGERQQKAAHEVENLSKALKRAAESLREDQDNSLADYVDAFAVRADSLSRSLEDQSPRELLHRIGEMVERKPEWFVGGMFVAGLTIARFLKASPPGSKSFESYENDELRDEPEPVATDSFPETFPSQKSGYTTEPDTSFNSDGRK